MMIMMIIIIIIIIIMMSWLYRHVEGTILFAHTSLYLHGLMVPHKATVSHYVRSHIRVGLQGWTAVVGRGAQLFLEQEALLCSL
jgi:hypothetical protein